MKLLESHNKNMESIQPVNGLKHKNTGEVLEMMEMDTFCSELTSTNTDTWQALRGVQAESVPLGVIISTQGHIGERSLKAALNHAKCD